ncbi:uncharacterized protein L969DRAFT_47833 [Mixia osmundae IAM 14324]|uniref:Uncharacterized protein n=1 Tax=Mixia osmundae (strain CBS 9802 / IAM 14324 / JCM 22182 / KY 12970) TaxID=764103 RepID=G7E9U7_MIXOS|nr:uncharacterized protein L969DRAFT_47833 [Mixia osmundae IAM 14324]KEI40049.1 hypothetical protein L969DRAFT_47833 [Mixia osmundae IAM 14324]GAA99416.1 hypothetical protein E5Q_06114 [Mixia osmundae IAM 14324]
MVWASSLLWSRCNASGVLRSALRLAAVTRSRRCSLRSHRVAPRLAASLKPAKSFVYEMKTTLVVLCGLASTALGTFVGNYVAPTPYQLFNLYCPKMAIKIIDLPLNATSVALSLTHSNGMAIGTAYDIGGGPVTNGIFSGVFNWITDQTKTGQWAVGAHIAYKDGNGQPAVGYAAQQFVVPSRVGARSSFGIASPREHAESESRRSSGGDVVQTAHAHSSV